MRVLVSVIAFALPAALAAQTAGTWGGEGRTDAGASLLHFRSDASARLLGLSVFHRHSSSGSSFGGNQSSVSVRLGIRKYRSVLEKARPFRTLSAVASYYDAGSITSLDVGGGAEFGMAYFFNSHVSLGVSGELVALVTRDRTSGGVGPDANTITNGFSLSFNGFRVLGGVYF